MSYSLYQASVPTFDRSLNAFLAILDKAEAHATAAKFDPQTYLTLRLRPDMYAFPRQVQAFCDHAKIAPHRLAGLEPPRFEDNESTLDELRARIRRTLEVIAKIDAATIDAAAEREVAVPIGGGRKAMMSGATYLTHFALPNFYFHLVTAYDILRDAGVAIGKRDYLGAPPNVTIV
jgi:hypothetical protein